MWEPRAAVAERWALVRTVRMAGQGAPEPRWGARGGRGVLRGKSDSSHGPSGTVGPAGALGGRQVPAGQEEGAWVPRQGESGPLAGWDSSLSLSVSVWTLHRPPHRMAGLSFADALVSWDSRFERWWLSRVDTAAGGGRY